MGDVVSLAERRCERDAVRDPLQTIQRRLEERGPPLAAALARIRARLHAYELAKTLAGVPCDE